MAEAALLVHFVDLLKILHMRKDSKNKFPMIMLNIPCSICPHYPTKTDEQELNLAINEHKLRLIFEDKQAIEHEKENFFTLLRM